MFSWLGYLSKYEKNVSGYEFRKIYAKQRTKNRNSSRDYYYDNYFVYTNADTETYVDADEITNDGGKNDCNSDTVIDSDSKAHGNADAVTDSNAKTHSDFYAITDPDA